MPKSLSVKNIPNLCRKLAYTYMQAFYTDWVYKVFWHFLKMYPICVECLHIGICKHSTQIGYIRLTPIPFLHKLGTFSKMCPICVECLRIIFNLTNRLWKKWWKIQIMTMELNCTNCMQITKMHQYFGWLNNGQQFKIWKTILIPSRTSKIQRCCLKLCLHLVK